MAPGYSASQFRIINPPLISNLPGYYKLFGYLYKLFGHLKHRVQTAAATGRIASNNPNLQAIPKTPFSLVMFPDAYAADDAGKFDSIRFTGVKNLFQAPLLMAL